MTRKTPTLFLSLFAAALLTPAVARAQDTVAIEGALVHVTPDQAVEEATIVIRDGAIAAVGSDVPVPVDARRIDAQGKVITAGLVEPSSRLGLVEVDAVAATNEGTFNGDAPIHAAYRVMDGYNPHSMLIPIARSGGVTSVVATPRGGLVSGTSAWVKLVDAPSASPAAKTPVAMHVTLGRRSRSAGDGSRGVAIEALRELFDDARQYGANKRRFERRQTRDYAAERLDLEALWSAIRSRTPLVAHAHRASDIRAALALGREVGVPVVIAGATEGWMLAEEIAAADAAVILNPMHNLPSSFDHIHVRDDAVALLVEAGVPVMLSVLGDASSTRNLRQVAGISVANGLRWTDALAAVTTTPATVFGVEGGSLEVGKPADLVVWSGDPFELSTRVEQVFIDGTLQPLESHQTRLLERYRHTEAER